MNLQGCLIKSFRVCTACEILLPLEKEEDEIYRACGYSMGTEFGRGQVKERDPLEELGLEGCIILKCL